MKIESPSGRSPDADHDALISADRYLMVVGVLMTFMFAISITGVATNVINIYAFVRMRVNDSVTISFLALAISDVGLAFCVLTQSVCAFVYYGEQNSDWTAIVNPQTIAEIVAHAQETFIQSSTLFTCFLSVTRAMCVAIPFRFKNYFTSRKTIVVLEVMFLSSAVHLLHFVKIDLVWGGLENNTTQLTIRYKDGYSDFFTPLAVLRGPVMTVASEVVVACSMSLMIYKLKKSLRFRDTMARAPSDAHKYHNNHSHNHNNHNNHDQDHNNHNNCPHPDLTSGIELPSCTSDTSTSPQHTPNKRVSKSAHGNNNSRKVTSASSSSSSPSMRMRELRVITQVTLVAAIFVLSKAPVLIVVLSHIAVPELHIGGVYWRTAVMVTIARWLLEVLCATSNIFVYFRYNSKYRHTLRSLMGRQT